MKMYHAAAGALILILAACSQGPEAVAEQFWEAGKNGDSETARSLVSENSSAQISEDAQTPIVEYGVGDATVDGTEAMVGTTLVLELGNGTREVEFETALIQEDGEWKIDLDQTTSRMMGVILGATMEDLGAQLGEAMKGAMEGVAEGLAEGMREMGEALGEAAEESRQGRSPNP